MLVAQRLDELDPGSSCQAGWLDTGELADHRVMKVFGVA